MKLSLLIRNLNEADVLRTTLLSISRQVTTFPFETVIVDNESTDNSLLIAEEFGCRVITMKRSDFSFGKSLNLGLENCRGEIVLLLSAHIILLNNDFLETIVNYFKTEKIAFARPVNVVKRKLIMGAFDTKVVEMPPSLSVAQEVDYMESVWMGLLIAHCSAVRRSVALEMPFNPDIEASEDKLWSRDVLRAGWKGICNIPCFFYYSKKTSFARRLEINFIEIKTKSEILGIPYFKGNGLVFLLKSVLFEIKEFIPVLMATSKLSIRLIRLGTTHKRRY